MFDLIVTAAIGLVCGGVVAVSNRLLTDRITNQSSKTTSRTLIRVFAMMLFLVGNVTVLPQARTWKRTYDFQRYLERDPVYRAIVADHPELEDPLKAAYLKTATGSTREEGRAEIRDLAARIAPPYLSKAPDDAILEFARRFVVTLRATQLDGSERCYGYLFPEIAGRPVIKPTDEGDALASAAQAAILRAHEDPRPVPEQREVEADLQEVMTRLRVDHGSAVQVMEQPEAAGIDRRKVCAVLTDLYAHAAALPAERGGPLLRYLFKQ